MTVPADWIPNYSGGDGCPPCRKAATGLVTVALLTRQLAKGQSVVLHVVQTSCLTGLLLCYTLGTCPETGLFWVPEQAPSCLVNVQLHVEHMQPALSSDDVEHLRQCMHESIKQHIKRSKSGNSRQHRDEYVRQKVRRQSSDRGVETCLMLHLRGQHHI